MADMARIRVENAMEWTEASRSWTVLEQPNADEEALLPIDSKGRERIWDFVVVQRRPAGEMSAISRSSDTRPNPTATRLAPKSVTRLR